MAAIVRDGIKAGALGFSSSRTLLHKDKHGIHVPGTFAGSDEMLALGLSMKGLDHGVFELVSDHLGTDDEWAWVTQFAEETGRPVTLVATSAGAYEGNKMFNIAEAGAPAGHRSAPADGRAPHRRAARSAVELPHLHAPSDVRERTEASAPRRTRQRA